MEIWKDIPWYEWKYQVSDKGSVKSLSRTQETIIRVRCHSERTYIQKKYREEIIMKHQILKWWYWRITLWKNKSYLVHRLVYCTFNNKSLDFIDHQSIICHIDDNKNNNNLENLYLWTQKENVQDSIRNGTHNAWSRKWQWLWRKRELEKRSVGRLEYSDVIKIRAEWIKDWENAKIVWQRYWVSNATICRILNNKIWI